MADATMTYVLKAKDETQGALKSAEGGLSGFAKQAASFAAGLGLFEVAKTSLSAVSGFLKESAAEAREAETQFALYSQVLKQASGASDQQVKDLKAQADAMKQLGGVSGDVVMQTQATLATFDLKSDSIKKLTPALTDLIAQEYKFGATEENARSIGNAFGLVLQGNVGALSRYGFKFDEATEKILKNGTETEKITALTQILNSTYEGANATLGKTSEGSMQKLNEQLKDIKENIGTFILPIMDIFMQKVVEITGHFSEWTTTLGSANDMFEGIKNTFGSAIQQFDEQTGIITQVRDAFNGIWEAIKTELLPALEDLWEANKPFLPYYEAVAKVIAGVFIVALKALLVVVEGLIHFLIDSAVAFSKFQEAILKAAAPAAQFMTKVVNGISDAIGGVIKKFNGMRDAAIGAFNSAKNAVSNIPFIGGALAGNRASGGHVMSGSAYKVGEDGPEIFVPGRSGTIIPNDAGSAKKETVFNFTFNGDVTDRNELVRTVIDAVQRAATSQSASRSW